MNRREAQSVTATALPPLPPLPTVHDVMTDGYEFAEHLLANQRKFTDEVFKVTSPMLPIRALPKAPAVTK